MPFAARKLSSVEATQALFDRIETWQPVLNAFVRLEKTRRCRPRREADATLARSGTERAAAWRAACAQGHVLHRRQAVRMRFEVREGWIAPATSTAIARLDEAGAIRIGALHMAEFAYGPTGHNAYLDHARNPLDPHHITGGSSSGSGAAVAARLTYAALGSDTGGSIRMPAHCCGVTGLKTTTGRVSRANVMPLSFTLDTVGPLARTADDCALIAEAMFGPDPLDPVTDKAPLWDKAAAHRDIAGLKVGVPTSFYVDGLRARCCCDARRDDQAA